MLLIGSLAADVTARSHRPRRQGRDRGLPNLPGVGDLAR